ncbi:MAG: YwmB family TATA-box binding protein, partial [Lachnospiraceae bacterium]
MNSKYKKVIIITVVSIFIFSQINTIFFHKMDNEFLKVFAATVDSTDGIEGHVEVSANTNNKYSQREEKEEVLKEMAKKFGIKDGYIIQNIKEDSVNRTTLTKYFEKAVVSISIADIACADNKEDIMQYMFWEIKLEENLDKILEYREKMREEMIQMDMVPVSNISLSSSFLGRVSREKKDRITERLLECMKARVVEEDKGEDMYIVYGYSPEVKESISYTDEKLNLNITFEYDEQQDETYLHLA